jgi:hypothetical protein
MPDVSSDEGIAAFLAARLDEDEATAKAATEAEGQWFAPGPGAGEWSVRNNRAIVDCPAGVIAFDEGCPTDTQAAHIARHDPARVLRSVAAVRIILAACQHAGPWVAYTPEEWLEFALPLLAAIYSDHPDYRPQWKPVTAAEPPPP